MSRPSSDADAAAEPATYTDADYDRWLDVDPRRTDRLVRALTIWLWDHGFQLRAVGVEHLPQTGAYLLVPNHSSYADPFLHVRPQRRQLRFMAKSTMFEWPILKHVIAAGGGFPVRRGRGDVFAMELARRLLRAGHPVVVYPEGTRFRSSADLGPAKRGFARLALELGVPIVPAATWGVKERHVHGRPWWHRPRATTVYGEPMRFDGLEPTRANVDRVRDEVWAQVERLYGEARRIDAAR